LKTYGFQIFPSGGNPAAETAGCEEINQIFPVNLAPKFSNGIKKLSILSFPLRRKSGYSNYQLLQISN